MKLEKARSRNGQSLVEYALGIGCVTAVCMVALGQLGFISWKALHGVEHAYVYNGPLGGHAHAVTDVQARPWDISAAGGNQ